MSASGAAGDGRLSNAGGGTGKQRQGAVQTSWLGRLSGKPPAKKPIHGRGGVAAGDPFGEGRGPQTGGPGQGLGGVGEQTPGQGQEMPALAGLEADTEIDTARVDRHIERSGAGAEGLPLAVATVQAQHQVHATVRQHPMAVAAAVAA